MKVEPTAPAVEEKKVGAEMKPAEQSDVPHVEDSPPPKREITVKEEKGVVSSPVRFMCS